MSLPRLGVMVALAAAALASTSIAATMAPAPAPASSVSPAWTSRSRNPPSVRALPRRRRRGQPSVRCDWSTAVPLSSVLSVHMLHIRGSILWHYATVTYFGQALKLPYISKYVVQSPKATTKRNARDFCFLKHASFIYDKLLVQVWRVTRTGTKGTL